MIREYQTGPGDHPRQNDCLRLLSAGLSRRAMAEKLGVSESTVKNTLAAARRRLGVDVWSLTPAEVRERTLELAREAGDLG